MTIKRVKIDKDEFKDFTGIRSLNSYYKEVAILISTIYIKDSYQLAKNAPNEMARHNVLQARIDEYYNYISSIFIKISALCQYKNEILSDMLYTSKNIKVQLKFY